MKTNALIMCLVNELAINVAKEFCNNASYNFYDLTEVFNNIEINSKTDLNKVAQNLNSGKISSEQLNIILGENNAAFVSNNFALLSENNLNKLKNNCAVVYIKVDKSDYLEYIWRDNLNSASKFKVDAKVFEFREKAYINCADVVLDGTKPVKTMVKKLIKSLENLWV